MASPVIANVVKSGAVVWYAPVGEAIPDESSVAVGAAWGGNWARIGYTAAPLVLTLEEERMQVFVEERLTEIAEYRTKLSPTFTTELAELEADYMALLFDGSVAATAAGAGQVAYDSLDIDPGVEVANYAIGFEGIRYDASANDLPVRMFFNKATFKINGDMSWSKRDDNYVKVPILVRGLQDGTNETVLWHVVTAPATS